MLHMSRKNKIIVSIVGISIISLALIGLTYGYYLTRIQGNTNNKSISISTANLELTYSDNSDVITGTNIVPGTTLGTKTFTVTNSGNNNVDSYSVGLVNVINTFTRLDDIKYTVTCSSSVTGKTCNGVSESSFPNENSYIIENQINSKEVQTYVIEVEYKEMNVDQSVDMGKTLEAKIDIFDTKSLTIKGTVTNSSENDYVVIHSKEQTSEIVDGKYKFIGIEPDTHKVTIKNRKTTTTKQTTLNVSKGEPSASGSNITYNDEKNIADADITITDSTVTIDVTKISNGKPLLLKEAILTSAKSAESSSDATRTIYKETPTTTPGQVVSNEKEKILSKTEDDDGDSYYFRGNVTDNYVNFANMCWRVVRIQGDGSTKHILEDQDDTCETSDGNWNIPTTTGGTRTTGNFGYTEYAINTLTASDGTKNTSIKYLMDYLNGETNSDKSMATAFKNFQTGPLSNYLSYLKVGDWCIDDKAYESGSDYTVPLTSSKILDNHIKTKEFYYDSFVRLSEKSIKEPTFKCNGTVMKKFGDNITDMYVGTLTADEIVFAGGNTEVYNENYYLLNNYHKSNSLYFWSFSPVGYFYTEEDDGSVDCPFSDIDNAYFVIYNGLLTFSDINSNSEVHNSDDTCDYSVSFRPAINLKSSIQITSGNGTKSNPYVVS